MNANAAVIIRRYEIGDVIWLENGMKITFTRAGVYEITPDSVRMLDEVVAE